MAQVIIQNLTRPHAPPLTATYCVSFLCQLKGLTFRRAIGEQNGLLLVQTHDSKINAAIHMLFMRFSIAVVWINSQTMVVDTREAFPWQIALFPKRAARYILETHPDRLNDFQVGDRLSIEILEDA
jgi:uncharacterized membrane protein (UPF0127 family)